MPTVVDLPLVPATPTPKAAELKSSARSLARVVTVAPIRRAACTSGTVSSTAADVTTTWLARLTPLPSIQRPFFVFLGVAVFLLLYVVMTFFAPA